MQMKGWAEEKQVLSAQLQSPVSAQSWHTPAALTQQTKEIKDCTQRRSKK